VWDEGNNFQHLLDLRCVEPNNSNALNKNAWTPAHGKLRGLEAMAALPAVIRKDLAKERRKMSHKIMPLYWIDCKKKKKDAGVYAELICFGPGQWRSRVRKVMNRLIP